MNDVPKRLAESVWLILIQRFASIALVPLMLAAAASFMSMRDSVLALERELRAMDARTSALERAMQDDRREAALRAEQQAAVNTARALVDERQDGAIREVTALINLRVGVLETRLADIAADLRRLYDMQTRQNNRSVP
jgi:biopolymer transport protein ExbB/TolQ